MEEKTCNLCRKKYIPKEEDISYLLKVEIKIIENQKEYYIKDLCPACFESFFMWKFGRAESGMTSEQLEDMKKFDKFVSRELTRLPLGTNSNIKRKNKLLEEVWYEQETAEGSSTK